MCRPGDAAGTLPMMPHNGSACQSSGPSPLFEIAIGDLKDSASPGVNRKLKLVLAAAYATHPERFLGGPPSRRRAPRKSGSTHPIPRYAGTQYRVRGEYPAIRLAREGTFA